MGYNISEVTGATGGGTLNLNTWTFDVTLNGTSTTTVSGDFDEVPIGGGTPGEASGGYTFLVVSGGQYGTLTNADTVTGEFTFLIDRSEVFDSGTDQIVEITVTGTNGTDTDDDTLFINLLICVARGTMIETAIGPVPVEQLSPDDMVLTVDGPPQPVRWVGSRFVSAMELRADPALRPIRIEAGAFGRNSPSRDLLVSPQHRILLGGSPVELLFGEQEVIVPAKGLVNETSICIDTGVREVEYFHVLFDRHEIMYTEGLATESFHPGGYALRELGSEARSELFALFPELAEEENLPQTARKALRPWEGALLKESSLAKQPEDTENWRMAS